MAGTELPPLPWSEMTGAEVSRAGTFHLGDHGDSGGLGHIAASHTSCPSIVGEMSASCVQGIRWTEVLRWRSLGRGLGTRRGAPRDLLLTPESPNLG